MLIEKSIILSGTKNSNGQDITIKVKIETDDFPQQFLEDYNPQQKLNFEEKTKIFAQAFDALKDLKQKGLFTVEGQIRKRYCNQIAVKVAKLVTENSKNLKKSPSTSSLSQNLYNALPNLNYFSTSVNKVEKNTPPVEVDTEEVEIDKPTVLQPDNSKDESDSFDWNWDTKKEEEDDDDEEEEDNDNDDNQPAMTDYDKVLKGMPKYDENKIKNFRSYINKLEKYFTMMKVEKDDEKIQVLRYSVAEYDRLDSLLDDCYKEQTQGAENFKTFKDKAIESIDGRITLTAGDIIAKAWELKFANSASPKDYYLKFIALKAQAKSGEEVQENLLVEAFLRGLPPAIRMNCQSADKSTLFDNFKHLEKIWIPQNQRQEISVNYSNYQNSGYNSRSRGRGYGRGGGRGRGGQQQQQHRPNHHNSSNFSRGNSNNNNNRRGGGRGGAKGRVKCYGCPSYEHVLADCPDYKGYLAKNNIRMGMLQIEEGQDGGNSHQYQDTNAVEHGHFGNEEHNNDNEYRFGWVKNNIENDTKISFTTHSVPNKVKNTDNSDPITHIKDDSAIQPQVAKMSLGIAKQPTEIYHFSISFNSSASDKNINLIKKELQLINNSGSNSWSPVIDSGAQRSIINLKTAKRLGLKIITDFNFECHGFDGSICNSVVGYVTLVNFKIPGKNQIYSFSPIVLRETPTDLAGLDLIKTAGGGRLYPDKFGNMQFSFNSEQTNLGAPVKTGRDSKFIRIKSNSKIDIQPGHIQTIEIQDLGPENSNQYILETAKKKGNLAILGGLIDNSCKKIAVLNLNLEHKISIHKDQIIANAFEAITNKNDYHIASVLNAEAEKKLGAVPDPKIKKNDLQKFKQTIQRKIHHISDQKLKLDLENILLKHHKVFDQGSSQQVGKFIREVSINPLNKEITVPPEKRRSFNPNVWDKIRPELGKLKELDLIEPCSSTLISPANLVPARRKGEERIRLCVDYKRLNSEISHNFFPLPTRNELLGLLGKLGSDMLFIKLDFSNFFWNFVLKEADRYLTAFYTENDVMQWKRLPFGLKSAPGIVQHALSTEIFNRNLGLHPKTAKSLFIDDSLFGVANGEIGLQDLDKILACFASLGMPLKLEKCEFLVKSVDFMGSKMEATENGVDVKVDPKNIKALEDIDTVKTESDLRGFLGLINWISEYVPYINLEVGPFYDLLSKMKKQKCKLSELWTDNIQKLFLDVKKKIADPKTLSVPDYSKSFHLEADASQGGFGAVLYQNDPKRVIAYASKPLRKAAQNYENAHRETACVVWAIEKFQHFFSCSPHDVRIWTDNRVTSFIKTAKSAKLRRWRSFLDSFRISIEHREGKSMFCSDFLSRTTKEIKNEENYQNDFSDELLEEFTIGAVQSNEMKMLELFQIHLKYGHCSAGRLSDITSVGKDLCHKVVSQCVTCLAKSRVKETKQILGTIKDNFKKNDTWYFDFVFYDNRKYISIIDRSTRFSIVSKVDTRAHLGVVNAFHKEITRLGKPRKIVSDREFNSDELAAYFKENDIEYQPLSRESPFLNLVERFHAEMKKIADRNNFDLERAVYILNKLSFTSLPKNFNIKMITPELLYIENNTSLIKEVGKFLEAISQRRSTRSTELRGHNIARFQHSYVVGDLVRFNVGNVVRFGKIIKKRGTKIYTVSRLDSNYVHEIHAQQLEKIIPEVTEEFLKMILIE